MNVVAYLAMTFSWGHYLEMLYLNGRMKVHAFGGVN